MEEPLYYTYRSDYDYFFWPIGISFVLLLFTFLLLLGINTEDEIYIDFIIVLVLVIFFIGATIFYFDSQYQTKEPEGLDEKSIVRFKSLWVRPEQKKRDEKELF